MKRYDSYKDSGVEWIGEVPSHWEVLSLLYTLRGKIIDGPHETPNYVEEGIPFISIDSINDTKDIDLSVVKKYISELDYKVYSKKTKIDFGDVLFTKAATIGKTAIVGNEKFMVWSPLAILKPNKEMLNNQFLYYLLNIKRAITAVILSGSFSTQINVGMREMEKLKIMLPSVREQESIVFYLDSKCGEIDKVISTQEKRIALLQELKQSIITHAVTKGLNPDVKMKDSGIEWIGEVPEHWDVFRLKHIYKLHGRIGWNGLKSDEFEEVSFAYLVTGQDFSNDNVEWCHCYQINKNRYDEDPFIQLSEGDILVTKDGTIGKVAVVRNLDKPACLNSGIFVLKEKRNMNNRFSFWYLFSPILSQFNYWMNNGATTIQHLYQNVFERMPFPVPPITEQQEIASYLDKRCAQIDASISKAQREIELLQEYKQSLITEVVTGKRKVC